MLTVETKFYRSSFDNRHKEDITWAFLSASVSADTGRDQTWSLDATLTPEGWDYLDPYLDWIAPVLRVVYPDGTVRSGQLGLYLVMDSPESYDEISGTVALDARDPLYLLSIQGFDRQVQVSEGHGRLAAIRRILDGAVLTEGTSGRPRYSIGGPEKNFRRPAEWPKNTSRLDLCNELAEGSGFYPLWTTGKGVITTRRRGVGKLRHRQEVRTFAANVPQNVDLDARASRDFGQPGHVIGRVSTQSRSSDMTNEIIITGGTPWEERSQGIHRIDHPDNDRSDRKERRKEREQEQRQERQEAAKIQAQQRRYRRWTRHHPLLDDDASAAQVARALADELSTNNTVVSFEALPDPEPEYLRETIGLAIWDEHGRKLAYGKYAVHRISWSLTNTSATMQIDAGRVQNADSLIER